MAIAKINNLEIQSQLKTNKFEAYQQALNAQEQGNMHTEKLKHAGIRWKITKTKGEEDKINPLLDRDYVSISTIRRGETAVNKVVVAHKLGYKISLEQKLDIIQEKYITNFLQSKSHNFIVSKFAQLKTAFLGQMLSNLGVTIPELQKMQKKALTGAVDENEQLFEENEYNAEMICIIGGSGKKLKKELQIMDEIRNQLITQATNFGKQDYYTEDKMLEIKINSCKRIKEEFNREKELLEYEKNQNYLNKDMVKAGKKGIYDFSSR